MKRGVDSMGIEAGFGLESGVLSSFGGCDIGNVGGVEGVLQGEVVEEKIHVYLVEGDFLGVSFSIFNNYKLIGIPGGGGV